MNRGDGASRGGVNLPALRGHNEAVLLGLLRAAGPPGLGRAELADRAGLTPQAVSKIAARLAADGLVADAGRGPSTGGKPRTLMRLVPGARHAVGVHLDRDELRAVRVDLAGSVVGSLRAPLDFGAGPEPVVDAVLDAVVRVCGRAGTPPLVGVGVAAPGPLDWRSGVLGRVTGFPNWAGFPLREVLAGRLGLPVVLDKDTNAAVATGGPGGPGAGTSVYLHVGTGLGAGLRLDGEIYRGARSAAGEFGHQVLRLDGPPCRCGGRGCLEVLCLDAVARGDLPEAARILGEGAANLVALLDVDRVLLGGRVVDADPDVFVTGVRAALAARPLTDTSPPTVAQAPGGVAEGAAELALTPLYVHPAGAPPAGG
ncbi:MULTISPECIES: ROK family transcriptional regulator [unclassified Streptomyces]|uniref:ROK family transcriptional regulator n=1 Tax=unclassified Streptomyces TaxID=2593676 RepID=UPI002481B20B|nr:MULTISPECIES: ROK family transcriptional regulator [unclassified Streptomyces]MDA5285799.1 ROK family transcriptional regulator [Streptomyces sp. Isolate_45]MDX2392900.1 ROK family transcriptional regulator [Streptomyces sp. DK15]